jgi:hypothetical protein
VDRDDRHEGLMVAGIGGAMVVISLVAQLFAVFMWLSLAIAVFLATLIGFAANRQRFSHYLQWLPDRDGVNLGFAATWTVAFLLTFYGLGFIQPHFSWSNLLTIGCFDGVTLGHLTC